MYLTYDDTYWAVDIEGDDLPSSVVWCICACNIQTGEEWSTSCPKEGLKWLEERRTEGCKLIGHNILGYDAPTLNRVLGTKLTISSLVDTLVLSMLYNPSLEGGHSLAAWGDRLKFPKGDFNDFSKFTSEMLEYCQNDARLCRKIYIELCRILSRIGFSEKGIALEHRAWVLIKKQQENGFAFNFKEAHILFSKLRELETKIKEELYEYWPPKLECVFRGKRSFKKDGSYSSNFLRHRDEYEKIVVCDNGEYECFEHVAFNIGSPPQRIEKLIELGWKPKEFTPTGKPKPTEKGRLSPSLVKFVENSGRKEPKLIAKWIEINSRANMINTWMDAYNEKTGCIHGTLWLANTLRYRHSNPNTANIPAVRKDKDDNPLMGEAGVFTYEARDLWTCRDPEKRCLVGVDAKGIQLRILAHYLKNERFKEAVLSEDPHEANRIQFGLPSRDLTKTVTYATLMGAGDNRIAKEAGISLKEAQEVKRLFFSKMPELSVLLNSLKQEVLRTGRLTLCDGSKILVDRERPYMAIPYLLQGDESRLMKAAAIFTNKEVKRRGLDVIKVGDIHDEWQNDVLERDVNEFALEVCPDSFSRAGDYFGYRVPIDCGVKIGRTWAETH